jgi:hypothetical protein
VFRLFDLLLVVVVWFLVVVVVVLILSFRHLVFIEDQRPCFS